MKYFSIHPSDLETQEFLSSSNDQIATWLLLHAFCSKQLNGGTITEADKLPDRFWTRHGIDHEAVKADSPLWKWNEANLTLGFYDLDGQELYQKKVEAGKSHGRGRGKSTAISSPKSSAISSPLSTPDREENRGEEIREEEIKKEYPPNPQGDEESELIPSEYSAEKSTIPSGASRKGAKEKGQTKVKFNTPRMIRINSWFRRMETTLWTVAEVESLIRIKPNDNELEGMENFYLAEEDPENRLWRKQSLTTLLNDWQGEADKARKYTSQNPRKNHRRGEFPENITIREL